MKYLVLFFVLINTCYAIDEQIAESLKWENTHLASDISDYGVATMVVAPYLVALKDDSRKIPTVAVVQVLSFTIAESTKYWIGRERPNGKDNKSFYSSHTSMSFVSAGLICAHDKKYCASAVVLSSAVGYLRIAANWHWFSDVVVGAGIGFVNGKHVPTLLVRF